jgi:hypothetical protein
MIERLAGRLSLGRRIATTAAMLGGLAVAIVVGLLWVTEPGLPARTRVAFGAIVVVGLAWFAYGAWALTWRLPLFALDRLVAAWMGLAACGLIAAPVILIAISRHRMEAAAVTTVLALLALATVNLLRARAHRAGLLRRRRELGG